MAQPLKPPAVRRLPSFPSVLPTAEAISSDGSDTTLTIVAKVAFGIALP